MHNDRQKILLFDNGREWGGGTNSMLELLKRIDRQKFDITCCGYYNYSRGEGETLKSVLASINIPIIFISQAKQPLIAKIKKELVRSLLFYNRSLLKRIIYRIDYGWRILPNSKKIRTILQQGHFDMLYMNNQPSTNVEGYLAAKDLAINVVQHCRIDPQLNSRLVKLVNASCHATIAVSHGVKNTLIKAGVDADRCFTVSNAIDIHQPLPDTSTIRQKLALPESSFIFGSIGSLILRKSHHHILHALHAFKQAFPDADWKMVIVGDGPERSNLEQLVRQLDIEQHIQFTGFRNNALDYLAAFDVFILASQSEGLPRVVLEGMLVNTAIIGSRVVGTAELIENNKTGLLFDYGDVQTLCQHLTSLFQSETLRHALVAQASVRVRQNYAIENYVSGVETILQKFARDNHSAQSSSDR